MVFFWHRRDLRLPDNAGLAAALASGESVLPVFIFDRDILDHLPPDDARVTYIHDAVTALRVAYEAAGGTLLVRYGRPAEIFSELIAQFGAELTGLFTNEDYEPYARDRDPAIAALLGPGRRFTAVKDQVIFAKHEILAGPGRPHHIFGQYRDQWLARATPEAFAEAPSAALAGRPGALARVPTEPLPTLAAMGFSGRRLTALPTGLPDADVVRGYHHTRDTPADAAGTTRASVHLRFGTLSVRAVMRQARELNEKLLAELIWRDYFMALLWFHPSTTTESHARALRHLPWRNDETEFAAWQAGQTGYPLVDAGMRELAATGFMQNRARIACASFCVKHLLIDWRWGERHFALHLLDYDLSQNIGNWQWVAGTGVVNAPWFRIFSPQSQLEKFDPELKYVRQWVPEVGTSRYVAPIVDHKLARERALATYKATTQAARP
ncbi:MAG: deoxyribodipyrimidine photo-lyase [Hymenobacteraceae bacterium]|nr:deoxyribodipyrimidine photo-lyase [Hymenobacteraceae bacterium]